MNQIFNETQKKYFINLVLVVTLFLALFLGMKAVNAMKEFGYIGKGVYPTNVITVNGTAEVTAIPDVASFSFSVVETAKTVKEAQDKATKKMNSALDAIKAMGVEEKDIKTESYNSYPKYDYVYADACATGYCPGKNVLTGYEVSQTISVKVRKVDTAGDILTKVGGLNVSNISGLSFVVDDMDKIKAEARDKAIADAKDKIKALSKSLGVKFVRITGYYDSSDQPMYYGAGGMEAKSAVSPMMDVAPQLPKGENKYTANVSITYEVK
jgi:uncharacterized protein YggE